jgi:hypothetical protein
MIAPFQSKGKATSAQGLLLWSASIVIFPDHAAPSSSARNRTPLVCAANFCSEQDAFVPPFTPLQFHVHAVLPSTLLALVPAEQL